jgi:hypothetical protein
MTATGTVETTNPIPGFVASVHRMLDDLAPVPAWSLTRAEQGEALAQLARIEARVAELRLRVLAAADRNDIAATTGATSTTAWLTHQTRCTPPRAHADIALAAALDDERHDLVRDALAAGHVTLDQARVIVRAVDALPHDAAAWVRPKAEKRLVAHAAHLDPGRLRILGRRIYDVVDPEAADHAEGRRLAAEEARAARRTELRLHDNGDGTHSLHAKLPDLHAAMLTKALDAFGQPARRPAGSRASRPELLGRAFCELLEQLPTDRLPTTNGTTASVLVMLDYDAMVSGLGTAQLDTGTRISAGEARRLMCTAGIVPAVFRRAIDGASVILDAGRRRRLFSPTQRQLLTARDQGCTADGCTRPAAWCQADHDQAWHDGGRTDLTNARLLCGHHHRKRHSPHYETVHVPGGKVRFHPRT